MDESVQDTIEYRFRYQESHEPQNMLVECILKGIQQIEEKEWKKLLASTESVAYWAKRSKELREEHIRRAKQ